MSRHGPRAVPPASLASGNVHPQIRKAKQGQAPQRRRGLSREHPVTLAISLRVSERHGKQALLGEHGFPTRGIDVRSMCEPSQPARTHTSRELAVRCLTQTHKLASEQNRRQRIVDPVLSSDELHRGDGRLKRCH